MKKIHIKPRFIVTGVLLLTSAALVTAAINRHKENTVNAVRHAVTPATREEPIIYDSVQLRKFIKTIHSLDFNQKECTYSGVVNLEDGNDTTNNVKNLEFLFSRSGSNYYYKLGNIDIIYHDGINVYVQHDQHKIVLSGQAINVKPPLDNIGIIEKGLQSEHYTLRHSSNGSRETLSLVNEHHISCKEIAVTLDTVSGKLTRLYTRTTDFGSPADQHKDRIMDVKITEIKSRANMELYPSWQRFVRKSDGKWQVTEAYQNYELIQF